MSGFNVWQFIAGVAVFVFAMLLLEQSLKNLAGRSFKKFLQRQSGNAIKMIASSTIVTALLQSSSVVMLMVLSFVGAGLMNMRGALAAMLGSNLGTTLDSWVIALIGFKINFSELSYVILGVALIGLLLSGKKTSLHHLTNFLIGFAFVFIALEWLKGSVNKSLEDYLGNFSEMHYLVFVPVGFIITAIVQSSSVMMAITLSALHNNLIPFESAAAVVIGSELGTSLKFLIASIKSITDKKRVAVGNFFLNFVTMVIAAALLKPLVYLINESFGVRDPLTGLVVFQTGINLTAAILFYPLLGWMARILEKIIVEKEYKDVTLYIHNSSPALPGDALESAEKEIIHFLNEAVELNKNVFGMTEGKNAGMLSNIKQFVTGNFSFPESYEKLKVLQGEILEYMAGIPKDGMTEVEVEQAGRQIDIVRHILRSAKNLKDIRHNLEDFQASANDNLYNLYIQMKAKARKFYDEFQVLLKHSGNISNEKITQLAGHNMKQYDNAIAMLLASIRENKIKELDSSTLLNVYREIYSSNKALIHALADLRNVEGEES